MAQYFGLSNRVAQGYMVLFKEKLYLTAIFSYKTIDRVYSDMEVREILEEVFELINLSIRDLEHEFGLDGSGLATFCKQNYENVCQSGQTSKGYEKIIVMVGLRYKLISAFKFVCKSTDHVSPYFKSLLVETVSRYRWIDLVSGVSGFLSWANCDLVVSVGGVPRFYSKKNSRLCSKGSSAWRRMLEELSLDPQKWLLDYHMCSNVEGCFSALKCDNPLSLRKELDEREQQEVFS